MAVGTGAEKGTGWLERIPLRGSLPRHRRACIPHCPDKTRQGHVCGIQRGVWVPCTDSGDLGWLGSSLGLQGTLSVSRLALFCWQGEKVGLGRT